jgi:hypothetical protein
MSLNFWCNNRVSDPRNCTIIDQLSLSLTFDQILYNYSTALNMDCVKIFDTILLEVIQCVHNNSKLHIQFLQYTDNV